MTTKNDKHKKEDEFVKLPSERDPKYKVQTSDTPDLDDIPLFKPAEKLLSKVTKEEPVLSDRTKAEMAAGAAAVKAEEEKLAAKEKAEKAEKAK